MKRSVKTKRTIYVTQTFLPKFTVYQNYLKQIWNSHQLTNNGPLVRQLEQQLAKYLHVKHCLFVSNGTIALQLAIRGLNLHGEIITTPFTYVATANAILWEQCTPVFVDIEPNTYTMNADQIEKSITKKTSAILAVHVYGFPCNIHTIEKIAKKHHLKVIYDAAHAFGATYKKKPLASYGDVATLSFHATKIFHTGEGGAVITNNDVVAKKVSLYRAFGHVYDTYYTYGINAKNSELHAALGLSILPSIPNIIKRLKHIAGIYSKALQTTKLVIPHVDTDTETNYAYYPVIFPSTKTVLKTLKALQTNNVFPRRYFFPALNTLPFLNPKRCPQAESVASRVLCLPIYAALDDASVYTIASIIKSCV